MVAKAQKGKKVDAFISEKEKEKVWSAYSLALNLGWMIITPIIVFGGGGVLLDKYSHTTPLFILIGFFLSITSSLLIVYIKTKDIIVKELVQINKKVNKPKK